ncbi:MAG: tol-pal system-associated acyl-CoA thioesterase [Magnetococcales bacterium]|nr:tol-pal system-associated acyl-CoA thioesterase [Magnetococcales bacterium]
MSGEAFPEEGAFLWPVRVYYEDTDAGGVVYHAGYLRFMERARTEWLRSFGLEQGRLAAGAGLAFVVTRVEIDFVAPARLDDALVVSVAVVRRRPASLEMVQSVRDEASGRLLVRARVRVAALDRGFRPTRVPEVLGERLAGLGPGGGAVS